ncbi:MAG: metallophosphoesterase, partial [Myxococcales bacterium]
LGAPDRAAREPWSFGVYGDVQDAIDRVQDIYRRMNEESTVRFVVIVGDLTEEGTPDQLERFARELKTLTRPVYATLGNHELGDADVPYHAHYGRGSSHFVFRGVHFTLLDSASATIDPIVYGWLDGWLAEGASDLHVVGMHIPPLDAEGVRNGSFTSRAEANKLLGRLARGGVDLSVYGHVHSYYAFANAGIPAFITGGGGAIPERMDGIGRHFLVFDADPASARITGRLVRVD